MQWILSNSNGCHAYTSFELEKLEGPSAGQITARTHRFEDEILAVECPARRQHGKASLLVTVLFSPKRGISPARIRGSKNLPHRVMRSGLAFATLPRRRFWLNDNPAQNPDEPGIHHRINPR